MAIVRLWHYSFAENLKKFCVNTRELRFTLLVSTNFVSLQRFDLRWWMRNPQFSLAVAVLRPFTRLWLKTELVAEPTKQHFSHFKALSDVRRKPILVELRLLGSPSWYNVQSKRSKTFRKCVSLYRWCSVAETFTRSLFIVATTHLQNFIHQVHLPWWYDCLWNRFEYCIMSRVVVISETSGLTQHLLKQINFWIDGL